MINEVKNKISLVRITITTDYWLLITHYSLLIKLGD